MKTTIGRAQSTSLAALLVLALSVVSSGVGGCGGGCPKPGSSASEVARWEQELAARTPLSLNPNSAVTIKRDVHNIEIDAPAAVFVAAFHAVMVDPNRSFGLIRVERPTQQLGHPFSLGDRFQGRYQIDQAIEADLKGWEKRWFGELAEDPVIRSFLCQIENKSTSDYGEISELALSPPPDGEYRMAYRYLSGSPIAGSSTFTVTPLSQSACRLTQVFEYQEQSLTFAVFFSAGGLKFHDQVVMSQATQAAANLGAHITASDIPKEYQAP